MYIIRNNEKLLPDFFHDAQSADAVCKRNQKMKRNGCSCQFATCSSSTYSASCRLWCVSVIGDSKQETHLSFSHLLQSFSFFEPCCIVSFKHVGTIIRTGTHAVPLHEALFSVDCPGALAILLFAGAPKFHQAALF